MDDAELERRLLSKWFDDVLKERSERIRDEAVMFSHTINAAMPDSREKSLALTHIEEALMWANKGLAAT
jgi:hypothetical protein